MRLFLISACMCIGVFTQNNWLVASALTCTEWVDFNAKHLQAMDALTRKYSTREYNNREYNLEKKYHSGYWYFRSPELLQGVRLEGEGSVFLTESRSSVDTYRVLDVHNYTINLMPRYADVSRTVTVLFELLKTNKELRRLIYAVKVVSDIFDMEQTKIPAVVIYPATGKGNAQKVLNILYETFKAFPASGRVPEYNEKITPFIFVTQGDDDHKRVEKNRELYESPAMIYFKPDVQASGVFRDYHLVNPLYYAIKNGFKSLSQKMENIVWPSR